MKTYTVKHESYIRSTNETNEKNEAIQEFCKQAFTMPKGHFAELKGGGVKAIVLHGMYGELTLHINGCFVCNLFCSSQIWEALA